jgi:starch phosphorylase
MRLLVDVHALSWDEAWDIASRAFGYTNHTLMPEALEAWPLELIGRLLPRHLEIIYEINERFLNQVRRRFPGDEARVRRMSLVDEDGQRSVRMANLATVGSHHVNGVSGLHSRLLRETVLADFAAMYPERFLNVTNGVTLRRFVRLANPALTRLLDETLGPSWHVDTERLKELEPLAEDAGFRERWREVRRKNKERFADFCERSLGRPFEPSSLVDAQCKRIHEYKRQHLNVLRIIALFNRVRAGEVDGVPRTFVFAGKAAPSYHTAKLIIRLVHGVAEAIDADPRARELLRVVFLPDFNVKLAQRILPAVDLSEQISTAGTEASGTGNMKFMLNGALTIGTLDGANVDIHDAVGEDHFFRFGLDAKAVSARRAGYSPRAELERDPELAAAVELISSGAFSRGDRGLFAPLVDRLVESDPFLVLVDFRSYLTTQERVSAAFRDPERWTKSSILNVARAGIFSSDRAIREYADRIWHVEPVRMPF